MNNIQEWISVEHDLPKTGQKYAWLWEVSIDGEHGRWTHGISEGGDGSFAGVAIDVDSLRKLAEKTTICWHPLSSNFPSKKLK